MPRYAAMLVTRAFSVGNDNPNKFLVEAVRQVNSKHHLFNLGYGLASGISGIMVIFLFIVFFWRRSLVNRTSLRLIFFITLLDCILGFTMLTKVVKKNHTSCQAYYFFTGFVTYTGIYASTAIAVNLHVMFLRPKLMLPRKYCEYLYFLVPVLAAAVHLGTLTGIAAKQGYCSAFEPYQPGTTSYVVFVVCAYMLTPALCLLYNIITVTRVIISLLHKQREINKSLQKISAENHGFLSSSEGKKGKSMMWHEEQRLRAARNVYNAAVRIAMYTIAPLAWFCLNIAYYHIQYYITLTVSSDIPKFVRMQELAWFGHAVTVVANFLVFVTDPSVVRVIKEVWKALVEKYPRLARCKVARVEPNQTIDTEDSCNSSSTSHHSLGLDKMDTVESKYQLAFPEPGDDVSAANSHSTALETNSETVRQRYPASQIEADEYIRRM